MEGSNYGFQPSMTLAIAAAAVFGLSAVVHLIQTIYYKTKFFTAFTLGALMMTAGYVFRALSIRNPDNVALYILQGLFIILPPTLYAPSLYMTYSRLVIMVNEPRASFMRPQMVTNFFVCLDMFSFLAQCGGSGMLAAKTMATIGMRLELLGFALQLASFSIFLFLLIAFCLRTRGLTTEAATMKHGRYHWKQLVTLLITASVLIFLRSTYRIVEFAQGSSGFLTTHEAYAYLIDAAPMLCVQIMFNVIHVGQVFPRDGEGFAKIEEFMKLKDDR